MLSEIRSFPSKVKEKKKPLTPAQKRMIKQAKEVERLEKIDMSGIFRQLEYIQMMRPKIEEIPF